MCFEDVRLVSYSNIYGNDFCRNVKSTRFQFWILYENIIQFLNVYLTLL